MENELVLPSAADIVKTNEELLSIRVESDRALKVSSCFSSYFYYEDTYDQISSIILNLIKNHYFIDANKRTAFLTFVSICEVNGITNLKPKLQYADIFESIAAKHYTVQQVSKLLFDL